MYSKKILIWWSCTFYISMLHCSVCKFYYVRLSCVNKSNLIQLFFVMKKSYGCRCEYQKDCLILQLGLYGRAVAFLNAILWSHHTMGQVTSQDFCRKHVFPSPSLFSISALALQNQLAEPSFKDLPSHPLHFEECQPSTNMHCPIH